MKGPPWCKILAPPLVAPMRNELMQLKWYGAEDSITAQISLNRTSTNSENLGWIYTYNSNNETNLLDCYITIISEISPVDLTHDDLGFSRRCGAKAIPRVREHPIHTTQDLKREDHQYHTKIQVDVWIFWWKSLPAPSSYLKHGWTNAWPCIQTSGNNLWISRWICNAWSKLVTLIAL